MKKLMNTLYLVNDDVTVNNTATALDVFDNTTREKTHIPLHMIEKVMVYGNAEISRSTLSKLVECGIGVYYLKQDGQLRYMVNGLTRGNVLLRKKQYLKSAEESCWQLPKEMIKAKLKNECFVLHRFNRNHESEEIKQAVEKVYGLLGRIDESKSLEELRGYEGAAARQYFNVFGNMILSDESLMQFSGRTRRPPRNRSNSMLSYAYTLLMTDCLHALECTGLDPYVGFIHGDRPGKPSLALDIMEELRPVIADRFVLRLINLKIISVDEFQYGQEMGVYLTPKGKKIFLQEWQQYKEQEVEIPELGKIAKGQIPFLQAQKVSAILRGEESHYKPLLWR